MNTMNIPGLGRSALLRVCALAGIGVMLAGSMASAASVGTDAVAAAQQDRLILPRPPLPFNGKIGYTYKDSTPGWAQVQPLKAPKDAPNVVLIVLDDVGYGQLGAYGSSIHTPNIDSLAQQGLRLTNFHTTALCSPTRAALLTGRNHHQVGIALVTEGATGYPGYDTHIPRSAATVAETLKLNGYNTMAFGKWHLTPYTDMTQAGPFNQWPLGMGFERFYGFLGGLTDQWAPLLVQDNTILPLDYPKDYQLSRDLATHAIKAIHDQQQIHSGRPFFLYFALGANHAPLQAPKAYIDHYRGKFNDGWDREREIVFARQKKLGLFPESTDLPPRDPGVPAWDSLNADQKKLYERQMETFAGYLEYADAQVGRVLDSLTEMGIRKNTLVILMSDNGASAEGGISGSTDTERFRNGVPQSVKFMLKDYDKMGGPDSNAHYPKGWAMAGNTPFKLWKEDTYRGGVSDPLIISWPGKIKPKDDGGLRRQYTYVTDVAPTILQAVGIPAPSEVNGIRQMPLAGTSFLYELDHPDAPTHKKVQYFEMLGNRGIWADGWKAVTAHKPNTGDWKDDHWALYHTAVDPTEDHDLSAADPDKLKQMIALWNQQARENHVLPLDDRRFTRANDPNRPQASTPTNTYTFYPDTAIINPLAGPHIRGRSYRITADLQVGKATPQGVLVSLGGEFGGWSFYLKDGRLHYVNNFLQLQQYNVSAPVSLSPGHHQLSMVFTHTPHVLSKQERYLTGNVALQVDGKQLAERKDIHMPFVGYSILSGYGWQIGRNTGTPVTDDYTMPFRFGPELQKIDVELLPPSAAKG